MDFSSESFKIPIVYKNNYMLELAIKDASKSIMLAGEYNLGIIEPMILETIKVLGLENTLSREQVQKLILEGMAEGMRN